VKSRRVFLCGLPGAGKSTVGPLLARRLAVPFRDLDAEIERRAGLAVREIFAREGEAGFRVREAAALGALCAEDGVVALGGGALQRPESLQAVLERGTLVWLDAPDGELLARIGDPASRPLLRDDPAATLARLRGERATQYARAQVRVDTAGLAPAAVAAQIEELLG
jgi:shikimate kinase